jgi:Mg-chelatase subunit ChlD
VKQIRNLVADTEQEYEKEKLNERIARLSGGVAIIQVRLSAAARVCSVLGKVSSLSGS